MKMKSSIVKRDIILSSQRYYYVKVPATYDFLLYLQVDSTLYVENMVSLFIFAFGMLRLPICDLCTLNLGRKWEKQNLPDYKT